MTHTKDTREAIARLIGDAAYDAGASVFDTRAVADAILSHLTALESAPAQAGGDVRELVADLIDFEAKCDADLDDRRGAGKTVFVEDIMHERLLEMNLDTPADIVRHFADPIRAALTATPAQAERSTPDKVALKNKIVSAILSYPPDTMSKAEFMADQILAAIPAQPTPSGEVDGLVAEIDALFEKATDAPWAYRPQEFDDWGVIRATKPDRYGICFITANARDGRFATEEEFSEHRKNGTDPYGPNAELIVALVNAWPRIRAQLEGET